TDPVAPTAKPTPVVKEAVQSTRLGTNDAVSSNSAMPPDHPAPSARKLSTASGKATARASAVSTALITITVASPAVADATMSRVAIGTRAMRVESNPDA